VPLLPGSVIWYQSVSGDAVWLGMHCGSDVTHWPCITDSSDVSSYGLMAEYWEMSTSSPSFLRNMCLACYHVTLYLLC